MPTLKKGHRRKWQPKPKPKQSGRKNPNYDFYNSGAWRRDRAAHLQANPYCVRCYEQKGVLIQATVSDHIRSINDGGDPWGWSNRQALCASCHNRKSGHEAHTKKKGGLHMQAEAYLDKLKMLHRVDNLNNQKGGPEHTQRRYKVIIEFYNRFQFMGGKWCTMKLGVNHNMIATAKEYLK